MKDTDGKGDTDAHTNAHLADQIDFGGHLTGQLLLIGAALGFQEVVVEADFLAVFRRDGHAEGSNHTRLTHKLHVDAKEDDAIEGVPQLQQGHGKQILILQIRLDQLLHGVHQRIGCCLVIVALDGRSVSPDDFLQRVLRHVENVHTIAGGHIELQAYGGLGFEQNGHIQPQESAVHVDFQSQLLFKVQIGSEGSHKALRTVQRYCDSHTDAGSGGAALNGHLDIQLGIADIGDQPGQGIGAGAVLLVQHPLGILAGHDGHQHLCLQFVVGGDLAGDGLLDLGDLLAGQVLLQIHLLGGVNIHRFDVGLGIRVDEGHFAAAVLKGLHGLDLGEQHIARQVAALPSIDGGFISVNFTVVEHDDLLRLQIDLAGYDQLAGNHIALGIVILNHVMYGAVLGIVGCVFNSRIDHGRVAGHIVPENVGQPVGELNDLYLITVDAHRQRVDIVRIAGKAHIVLHIQGKGATGGEARLAVELRAVFGFPHGDLGSLQAGTNLHGDVLFRLGRGHALGQHQPDARRAVGKTELGDSAGVFPYLLLIGGIHGIEGHALLDGRGIAKGRGAFLVHAPAAKGIALFGGVQALHRLGQQVLALGEHHRLQLTAAEGFKGNDRRLGLVDEPGVQGHLPVHGAQTGNGVDIVGVFVPGGENLARQGGVGLGEVHHAAGGNLLGLHGRALGDEGNQPLVQHEIHLLAGLQFHDLGVGAGHFEGFVRFIDHGTGGADGQGAHGLLHTNHAQRAAALNDHFVGTLDDHLGKLRARIHMEVDHIGLVFLARLDFLFHRGITDVYAGDLAFAQIDAAPCIHGERGGLDGGQRQLLRPSHGKAIRQYRRDGKVVAQKGDVARLALAPEAVDGFLGVDHGREGKLHQLHILIGSDGSGGIDPGGFFGQISLLREDGKIDAVIFQTQFFDAFRKRVKIDVCRVFDNIAQHTGDLPAGFRPGDLLRKGKHIAGGLLLSAYRLCNARQANVGHDGDHQNHRNDFLHKCLHFLSSCCQCRLVRYTYIAAGSAPAGSVLLRNRS